MSPSSSIPLRHRGRVIAGKYELKRPIGRGSMGEVWIAHHRTLDYDVAVKLLCRPSDSARSDDASASAARFLREAQVAARLSRKTRHIVRVTDHGEENGLAYFVMELLSGRTLESRLMHYGHMPLAEVADVVTQVARALTEAHAEGIVHRDLKPANIFLAHDEDGALLVKLLDFGVARATEATTTGPRLVTVPGVLFGTPGYMSPEQLRMPPAVNLYCDLWALATVAYELLTGDLPVAGVDPVELDANLRARRLIPISKRMPQLPSSLDAFFQKAFAERPEERYASASDLARAFERAAKRADGVDTGPRVRSARQVGHHVTKLRMRKALAKVLTSTGQGRGSHARAARILVSAVALAGLLSCAAWWRLYGGPTVVASSWVATKTSSAMWDECQLQTRLPPRPVSEERPASRAVARSSAGPGVSF